jgi:predicted PurR-regulated permease PerM
MNATEYAKSFLAICAAIGLFCSIVGSGFWGVTNVLAQIAGIESTQEQQVANTAAIANIDERVTEIDDKLEKNAADMSTLIQGMGKILDNPIFESD